MVKTVNQHISKSRPEFPNETLGLSWDILQAIRRNFKFHPHFTFIPCQGSSGHVLRPNEIPFPAQFDIRADLLATLFQQASTHTTDQGPMIPGTGCHLLVENQFIPGYHHWKLRTKWGQRRLLQSTTIWCDNVSLDKLDKQLISRSRL